MRELKEEYGRAKVGNRYSTAPYEVFSTHVPDVKRCTVRDATLVTCLLLGERRCAIQSCRRCRPSAGGSGGDRDGTRASSFP